LIKQCDAASGRVPYSTLWVYNKLVECRSVEHFDKLCNRYFPLMDSRDLQYLNNIPDHAQYPVKRCEQGAYMYHCQTSQGSEVMHAANIDLRARTAVCSVNAAMLTIKTKCRRYQTQQTSACALENKFSPCGEKEYSEVFGGIIQIYCLWYVTLYHSLQYIVSFANKLSNLMNKLHLQKK
jgi:hypothetical protein